MNLTTVLGWTGATLGGGIGWLGRRAGRHVHGVRR